MQIKSANTNCKFCSNNVSELANFVKIGPVQRAHVECFLQANVQDKLAEQERVLTEGYVRKEKEYLQEINTLRQAKGATAVVSKESTVTFDTKTWDEAAEKICKLAIAHIGPAMPLGTLKRYAWFIYMKLRDEKLIQPLRDDEPEETMTEAQLRSKAEMEEWLRNSTKEIK